jgi:hypothetical protein
MAVFDRDLAASKTPGLHNDWSFNIAYNAALQERDESFGTGAIRI